MKPKNPVMALTSWLAVMLSQASAQTAPTPPEDNSKDSVVELSPFVVTAEEDEGYAAKATLAGTRIRTELKDVGSSVSVVTKKFLDDTQSNRAEQLLVYTPNSEVSGQGGNYLGRGDGALLTDTSTNLNPSTRVRGLVSADLTRDFFLTDIPWDSYNTGRIDLQRGPNAVLFGIGSPGGIINSSPNQAAFKNSNKVEFRYGSFDSTRFSADFNRVILKDQLAVRLSLLQDNTNYRQDPAFQDDKRIYGAIKYDPAFLNKGSAHTSLRASYEKGNIDANTPRNTPPLDALTPWFGVIDPSKPAKPTYNPNEINIGMRQIPGFAGVGSNNTTAVDWQINPDGSTAAVIMGPSGGVPLQYSYSDLGVATFDKISIDLNLPGSQINAWKARSLTDRGAFDFYNNLLEGPNKFEFMDFTAFNAALSQTFFRDRLGVELAYDRQKTQFGGFNYLEARSVSISPDLLTTRSFGDPNAQVGKPLFLSAGGFGEWTHRTREVVRATAFGELNMSDFVAKESWLNRIFGRNVFTGVWSSQKNDTFHATYSGYFADTFISQDASAKYHSEDFYNQDIRFKNYLGPAITGNSPSTLGLQGLKAKINPTAQTLKVWNYQTGTIDTIPLPVINNVDAADSAKKYSGADKSKDKVDSLAFVWQGYWLDGSVIPMFGWRQDEYKASAVNSPPPYTIGRRQLRDIYANTFLVPEFGDGTKVRSKTYSLVTHLPSKWRDKLPGRLDVSLILNKSENIQPGANRHDLLGNNVADPTGNTKEYGVAVTALNDRLTLKVVHYETKVKDASIGGLPTFEVAASEVWGQWAAFNTRDLTHVGQEDRFQSSVVYGYANGDPTKPVTWLPDGAPIFSVNSAGVATYGPYPNDLLVKAFNDQRAAVDAWFANQITDPAFLKNWLNDPSGSSPDYSHPNGAFPFGPGPGPTNLAVTGDTISKGYEFELIANPLKGLNVIINASKTSAKRTSLAKTYSDWLEARWKVFQGPAGDIRMWGFEVGGVSFPSNDDRNDEVNGFPDKHGKDGETVRGRYGRLMMAPYWFYKALEDSDVPELRPWTVNFIADYTFQEGNRLKGFNIGGGYRWQDRSIVGFPVTQDATGVYSYDVAHPYKGSTEGSTDAWIGYNRKIYRGVKWRIQLNVRNAFADDHLSRVTVQPDGSPAAYRIPEPRTFMLTNSFEF